MSCKRINLFTVCSYSRKALKQTGDGHFGPVAMYNKRENKVLLLDIARFKYPSLWYDINKLYSSFYPKDKTTGLSRGFIICGKYY